MSMDKSRFLFFIHGYIFRHLKLEIALAIPGSNEWKLVTNHFTWYVLTIFLGVQANMFSHDLLQVYM